jgi:hypothetical protein
MKNAWSVPFLLTLALPFVANNALAATVSFDLTDFYVSTSVISGANLFPTPSSAPTLPADSTFTLPAEALALPPNPSNTYLANYEGKFLRFTFDLPAGSHGLAFTFEAVVNDEFALYVNDTVVAIQSSTGTDNFDAPLPGFAMNAAGTATDTSGKLEYLLTTGMQPLFHAGTNKLTLFGTDTLLFGGISAINGTITAVPEPEVYGMMLAGIGLLIVTTRRRSMSSTSRHDAGRLEGEKPGEANYLAN